MSDIYEFYRLYGAELTMTTAAVAALLLLWVIALQWRLSRLHRRYRAAMAVAGGVDLEKAMIEQRALLREHAERLLAVEAQSQSMQGTLSSHAGRVGIVRFNPFQDSGGDQSFSIAWVDDQVNGVVISSLYSRSGTRIYAKPLARGNSSYNLTEEEQEAIRQATSAA